MFNGIVNAFRTKRMKIAHQQKVAAGVVSGLKSLPGMVGKPVVAGGAPRDWFLDRVAADIDIFIHSCLSVPTIKEQLRVLNVDCTIKTGFSNTSNSTNKTKNEDEYYPDTDKPATADSILCVFETTIKGEKVQLIFINTNVANYIHKFPIDICMIMWEDKKFVTTSEFMKAINTGVLTLKNKCKQKYIDKIKAKFPDFDFKYEAAVVPTPVKKRESSTPKKWNPYC